MTQYAPNSESNVFERSLVLIKPDAVQRKLVGKIIERFENKGLKLVAMKLFLATREMAEEHYIEHQDRAFFEKLMDYMTSHPLIPMVWEGPNSIKIIRNMLGVHDPTLALAGTIRGDFSVNLQNNVIHGSDSIDAAKREINIWFQPNEIPY
ncbi:nucleoside diphosphate kinase-like [Sitodiplosis mosellana]|uniref:nucleoside diphosphate kinase-like n=1 Tax=Sitodiplosis mosellana TaxID=263140 RepID=UPI002443ADD0|nr:nucleoside diphosphate kinase-like [Sitodiplosis mosellana]